MGTGCCCATAGPKKPISKVTNKEETVAVEQPRD